jgi:hypothetical protein
MPSNRVVRNSSNLSWLNVAASVICPPAELFLVVVTMSPARAKRAKERMHKATTISIRVKPSALAMIFINLHPSSKDILYFRKNCARPIPMGISQKTASEDRRADQTFI